ncbi:hypothetical protein C2E23DRAFT_469989 [Lenzites betulinus]|nr:hypothetical protein C2E23DRAFT_469989 [Lenzites betulinus]
MRFLNTSTCKFHEVDKASAVSYAIISYAWRSPYGTIPAVFEKIHTSPEPGRAYLDRLDTTRSPRIRKACEFAAKAGYEYLWLQDCCVNTSPSSAEPGDVYNMLWQFYIGAGACYAYLADVPPQDTPHCTDSHFRRSSWHTGVWSLPALLAPPALVFLAQDWSPIGTKSTLAPTLAAVTGIDLDVLRGQRSVHDVSIAGRMSWASQRKDWPFEEDIAFSLLGLFGVRMRLNYGERNRAFLRLQTAIVRANPQDQSIFAWHFHGHSCNGGLFASSTCCFSRSGDITPILWDHLATRLGLASHTSSYISAASRGGLPLIPHHISAYPPTTALYDVFGVAARFSHAAILRCADAQGRIVVLTLEARVGMKYTVEAVETALGQHDRAWRCAPASLALYARHIEMKNVDSIQHTVMQLPWVIRPPKTSGGPLVSLDSSSQIALKQHGYIMECKWMRRGVIDDLYVRTRRARRFEYVYSFRLSPAPAQPLSPSPSTTGPATAPSSRPTRHITIDVVARRTSRAPIPPERVSVRWCSVRPAANSDVDESASDSPNVVNDALLVGPPREEAGVLYVQYAVGIAAAAAVGTGPEGDTMPTSAGVPLLVSLQLSRILDSEPMRHVLRINLEYASGPGTVSSDDREEIYSADEVAGEKTGMRPAPGSTPGQRSVRLPRLGNIRGWTRKCTGGNDEEPQKNAACSAA